MLIVITPTHNYPRRLDCIRRVARWIRHGADVRWVVIEDGDAPDPAVRAAIDGPETYYLHHGPTRHYGNAQRTAGLEFALSQPWGNGVVYLADDDNGYDVALLDELRKVRRAGIFPVGNLGPSGIEGPVVRNGRIVGWDACWKERRFPTDMAGFAVHTDLLRERNPRPLFPSHVTACESKFLESLGLGVDDLEPLCSDCTRCLAWHNQPL